MADFVAVLRKTIGALGDNTPEMRERVYDKARSTIEAKLAALDPQPPAAVIERQRKALDDAIAVVRADYADPVEPEPDDGLEDIFASLEEPEVVPVLPVPAPPAASTQAPVAELEPVDHADEKRNIPPEEIDDRISNEPEVMNPDYLDPPQREASVAPVRRAASEKSGKGRLVGALIVLLLLAGGAFAYWFTRDEGPSQIATVPPISQEQDEGEAVTTAEELVEPASEDEAAAESDPAEEEIAAVPPETEQAETTEPQAPAAQDPEKFTQRLLPDGSEEDEGPAGGQRTIGEGTSVAALAQQEEGEAGEPGAEAEQSQEQTTEQGQPAVAVGQRAIFYEERTSSAQGSAELGAIVWSLVQESPGGELPPEPAIRAEASIPGKDVQLRMTIRRNGDQTLPAAHIIEMIFLTPEGFEGGAISNVSRIAFKETEQAAGNPLLGIPAKIADGFFLIALSDAPTEIEANMTLLRRQSWIDIPIVYQSGRRALLSLEKGIPGDRVFQEALNAWAAEAG